jgi:chromosome segregation protein
MKLRRIEIQGFKSFRDRVSMDIGDGMTCVVGPNGCGKSNVVDSIKWAMGDMSAKSLRGESMQDVIFAGSETHKPMNMAEVTLTFENTATLAEDDERAATWREGLPREFQDVPEIAITRRLFRTGETEYLINKIPCRLLDIQNLLAGTGLGKQGYSIIEQGQIGYVVNARPSQRRLIIEEASGITRYKSQRERAERKLEKTEQNLARVTDVLDEITKQLRNLERQARRAEEHRELTQELRQLEIATWLARRAKAAMEAAQAERGLDEARRTLEAAQSQLDLHEQGLRTARVEAHQADRWAAQVTEEFYKLDTRLNLARSNREHSQRSADDARERLEGITRDLEHQRRRQGSLDEELQRILQELEVFDETPQEAETELIQAQKVLEDLRADLRFAEERRRKAQVDLSEKQRQLGRVDDRIDWATRQNEEFSRRSQLLEQELARQNEEVEDVRRAVQRLEIDLEQARQQHVHLSAGAQRAEQTLKEAQQAEVDARRTLQTTTSMRIGLEAQVQTLEAMRLRGEGYDDGVREVLSWARSKGRDDVLGPAADFLKILERDEAAVAAYLGDRLSDVLVTTREAAFEAVSWLKARGLGRVSCVIVDRRDENPEQVVARWLDGLRVVDTFDEIPLELSAVPTVKAWATRQGDVCHVDGRIIGGATGQGAEAILRQVRRLEELQAELERSVLDEAQAREAHEVAEEDLGDARQRFERLREEAAAATHRCKGLEQERDRETRQLERVEVMLGRQRKEFAALEKSRVNLLEEKKELEDRRDGIGKDIPELEASLEAAAADCGKLQVMVEVEAQSLTDRRVRLAQVRERRLHLEESKDRLTRAQEAARQQIGRLERDQVQQQARIEELQKSRGDSAQQESELEAAVVAARQAVDTARGKLSTSNGAVQRSEIAVMEARKVLQQAQDTVQSRQLAVREGQVAREHADEQLESHFHVTLDEAREVAGSVELDGDKWPGRIHYLRGRLDKMGPVNALAIEEFEETRERKEFLEAQSADLQASIADLRGAILRMDRESRRRFKETFEAVDAMFQKVFPRLFRGGRARLLLTDPEDMLNTGVDIEVQPPGKALQNVTLLSGGEKALTAVSLIFSIFLLKPTPFCILDEVDAPLDEANVGRFAEMVRELSETSQMLVITHNRRTMEAPRMLYGVTMEEPGVSKIVAVRLSEIDGRMAS